MQLQKGVNAARADDAKGLKTAIIDWIAPAGQPLVPVLTRNNKIDRGYNHPRTGQLLCPAAWDWMDEEYVALHISSFVMIYSAPSVKKNLRSGQRKVPGEHWPTFVYEDHEYDPMEPWQGLFKGRLLVLVCSALACIECSLITLLRHTNIYSPRQARSMARTRQPAVEMRVFTE